MDLYNVVILHHIHIKDSLARFIVVLSISLV